jgi:hypothetical protein
MSTICNNKMYKVMLSTIVLIYQVRVIKKWK